MTIKELRKKHNLTQKKCAEYLGIPLRTYQNYEKDNVNTQSIKYQYILEKLTQYGVVDEGHGILSTQKIIEICKPILSEYKVKYCYLFGSYAKNKATETSDIDLLVNTELTGINFYGLAEALREGLNKKVDILNQNQIKDNYNLINEILTDGIKIYG